MRGNKILERLTVKDSNTPHSCDYRYIDRLNAWQDAYDQTLNQDYPPLSGFPTLQAERDFKREAINLWKKLRLELAPEDYEFFHL